MTRSETAVFFNRVSLRVGLDQYGKSHQVGGQNTVRAVVAVAGD